MKIILLFLLMGCAVNKPFKTAESVDLDKFVSKWYVIAGRLTMFEDGAHNAVEDYSWSENKEFIKINFYFNQDSFDGKIKEIPQKAWVHNFETNAHWKVRPFWPLKLDYIILDVADDYSWTAVGVPSQKYLWIMAKDWQMSEEKLEEIKLRLKNIDYSTEEIIRVPQKW
jgi:apolipoprotein D and lipocalin family protein